MNPLQIDKRSLIIRVRDKEKWTLKQNCKRVKINAAKF